MVSTALPRVGKGAAPGPVPPEAHEGPLPPTALPRASDGGAPVPVPVPARAQGGSSPLEPPGGRRANFRPCTPP